MPHIKSLMVEPWDEISLEVIGLLWEEQCTKMKRHFFKSAVVLPSNDTLQVRVVGFGSHHQHKNPWVSPQWDSPVRNGVSVSQKTAHPPRFIAGNFGRVHNPISRGRWFLHQMEGESTFRNEKPRSSIWSEVLDLKETRVKGEMLHNIEIRVNGCCEHQKGDELLKFGHLPWNRPR